MYQSLKNKHLKKNNMNYVTLSKKLERSRVFAHVKSLDICCGSIWKSHLLF